MPLSAGRHHRDLRIAELLKNAHTTAVQNAINIAVEEQNLQATKQRTLIQTQVAELEHSVTIKRIDLDATVEKREATATMEKLEAEISQAVKKLNARVEEQKQLDTIAAATLSRCSADENFTVEVQEKYADIFTKKFEAYAFPASRRDADSRQHRVRDEAGNRSRSAGSARADRTGRETGDDLRWRTCHRADSQQPRQGCQVRQLSRSMVRA